MPAISRWLRPYPADTTGIDETKVPHPGRVPAKFETHKIQLGLLRQVQADTPAGVQDDFELNPVVSAAYGLNHRLIAFNPFGMGAKATTELGLFKQDETPWHWTSRINGW